MIKKVFAYLIDLLFPLSCSFCGKFDFFSSKLSLCKSCYRSRGKYQAFLSNELNCPVCKAELVNEDCLYCNSRNVFFENLSYVRIRGDFEREIIQKVKFGNSPYLSNYFRIGLRKFLSTFKKRDYTAIVNIPSNKKTIRNRPIPVCKPATDLLIKELRLAMICPFVKNSKELQSGKSFRERFLHAQSAFTIGKAYKNNLNGSYLLVDDVFTTGATINEMSKLLLMNGAKKVDVLVLIKGKV